jgi:hypothetical protein
MENNLTKVSLGFAEFVSQLVHETFDAIVGSQFYQIDKYAELLAVLNTPNNLFRVKYISDEEFKNFQEMYLGFIAKSNLVVDTKMEVLKLLFEEIVLSEMIINNKLTGFGLEKIEALCENKLIESKKNSIRQFMNEKNNIKLSIESGEIKTRIDLFCLNEGTQEEAILTPKNLTKNSLKENKANIVINKGSFSLKENKLSIGNKYINIQEIVDKETNLTTILIKKQDILAGSKNITSIPTARLVVNPLGSNSATNIFSEVTIKFSYK